MSRELMGNVSSWLDNMAKQTGLDVNSPTAKRLMDLTMGIESHFGKFRKQIGGGPAEGIFQIEPKTRKDIFRYARTMQPAIYKHLQSLPKGDEKDTVLARTKYYMKTGKLPESDEELSDYWKVNFQGGGAKGATAAEALARYQERPRALEVPKESIQVPKEPMQVPSNVVNPINMGTPPSWKTRISSAMGQVDQGLTDTFMGAYQGPKEAIQELTHRPAPEDVFNIDKGGSQVMTPTGKLARVARKWGPDMAYRLGDIMQGFQENQEMPASDAAEFAMMGLLGGEPGGLPAGTTGAGSITKTKLPFTSRLSKFLERGMIGDRVVSPKTKMGELAGMIGKDPVLAEEFHYPQIALRQNLERAGESYDKAPLSKMKEKYLNAPGDYAATIKEEVAPELAIDKYTLTGDDTQYDHFEGLREVSDHNYQEVVYKDPTLSYTGPHFFKDISDVNPEFSPLSEGYVGHRRGGTTSSSELPGYSMDEIAQIRKEQGVKTTKLDEISQAIQREIEQSQNEIIESPRVTALKDDYNQAIANNNWDEVGRLSEEITKYADEPHPDINTNLLDLSKQQFEVNREIGILEDKLERPSERKMFELEKAPDDTYQVTESQSDLHQQASKAGGYSGEKSTYKRRYAMKEFIDGYIKENPDFEEVLGKLDKALKILTDPEIEHESVIYENAHERYKDARKYLTKFHEKAYKTSDRLATTPPQRHLHAKQYWQTQLRDAMSDAVQMGMDHFTWTTGKTQAVRNKKTGETAAKYFNQYDKDFVKFMKKEFGVTPGKRFIPDLNHEGGLQEVWHIPITDAIKKLMKNAHHIPMAKIDKFRAFG